MDAQLLQPRSRLDYGVGGHQSDLPPFQVANEAARPQSHDTASNAHLAVEQGRRSISSSVYEDDNEWVGRISRLSVPSEWRWSAHVDNINFANEQSIDDPLPAQHVPVVEALGEKGAPSPIPSLEVDRDLRSRNLAVIALLLSILVGVTCLASGFEIVLSGEVLLPSFFQGKYITMGVVDYPFSPKYSKHYLSGHRVFSVTQAAMLSISLLLNIGLTILFDGINFIQNTTLRWSLCKEGRLVFSSNPRLFVGARNFAPNGRVTNAVSSLALVLGYASISVLTCSIYVVGLTNVDTGALIQDAPVPGQRYAIDFSGWGFIGLGISLLLQGSICTWCLCKSKIVPTWSSNPFNTALVCAMLGLAEKNNKCMNKSTPVLAITPKLDKMPRMDTKSTWASSVDSESGLALSLPSRRQPAMRLEVPRSRTIMYCIWTIFAAIVLWTVVVVIIGQSSGNCSRTYVIYANHKADFLAYWSTWCQAGFPYYVNPYTNRRDWAGLLIQTLALSFITLGVHCAELLIDISRDESAWRKATTVGADAGRGALVEGSTSWEFWVLFLFKVITPWMFSFAFDTNLYVYNNLIPLATLALIMLLLALFSEYLVRRRPKGPQPATYGNIAKLVALVDEWHPRIFWGDKGMVDYRIRRAGTSAQRLADLDMNMLYANLRA